MVRGEHPNEVETVEETKERSVTKLVIQTAKQMGGELAPGEYIRMCEELEYFFGEEGQRTLELLEQIELGIVSPGGDESIHDDGEAVGS